MTYQPQAYDMSYDMDCDVSLDSNDSTCIIGTVVCIVD